MTLSKPGGASSNGTVGERGKDQVFRDMGTLTQAKVDSIDHLAWEALCDRWKEAAQQALY